MSKTAHEAKPAADSAPRGGSETGNRKPPVAGRIGAWVTYTVASLIIGLGLEFAWVYACAIAEKSDNAAHPGGGASFFTLIPIVYGPFLFLLGFPTMYVLVLVVMPSVSTPSTLRRWLLPNLTIVAYVIILAVTAMKSRDYADFLIGAAFWMPVVAWRIYSIAMTWVVNEANRIFKTGYTPV